MSFLASIATSTPTETDPVSTLQALFMVLGIVALGAVIMVSVRAKIARRQEETGTPRERLEHGQR